MPLIQPPKAYPKALPTGMAMKNQERTAPRRSSGIKIADDGGGGGAVAGLADAEEDAGDEHGDESGGEAGGAAGDAPEGDADADDHPARIAVGHPAKDGRGDHVTDEEGGGQQAGLAIGIGVAAEEFVFDRGDDRGEDVAVEVAEEIDRKQQGEGGAGTGAWWGAARL